MSQLLKASALTGHIESHYDAKWILSFIFLTIATLGIILLIIKHSSPEPLKSWVLNFLVRFSSAIIGWGKEGNRENKNSSTNSTNNAGKSSKKSQDTQGSFSLFSLALTAAMMVINYGLDSASRKDWSAFHHRYLVSHIYLFTAYALLMVLMTARHARREAANYKVTTACFS
jgi:hypothetical protein